MDVLALDVRHIVRSLTRHPAYAVAAVLTLALGLGGVIAIVSVADMVLLRPLPYPRPERLYALSATLPGPAGDPAPYVLSPIEFLRVRETTQTLEQVEAMTPTEMSLTVGDRPATIRIGVASAGYLQLFGLDPVVGRNYTEAEARARAAVVILDGGLWQRQFGSDPAIVGQTVRLDGAPYVVFGVTPAGYQPQLQKMDAWIPLAAVFDPARQTGRNLLVPARLAAGATEDQAREELRAIQATIAKEFPQSHGRAVLVFRDMHEALYGSYRPVLRLLFGGVSFLLFIACINVANLILGRVTARQGEIALRLSLGASRRRVIGYHLTESAVLASVGTVVGILLAWWSVRTLVAIDPDVLPRDVQPAISGRLAAMVGGALAAATVAAGLLPAWRAGLLPASSLLAQASVRQAGRGDRRTREWMLGVQVASAVLLLSAAGVVAASFGRLTRVNPGFDPTRVLTLQLAPPARLPDPQARALLVARILERVEQVPGVAAAGTTQTTWQPLSSMSSGVEIEGLPETSDVQVFANIRHVTPGYFTALRVPIEDGRPIDVRDKWGAAPVAMVSRSFADRFWPGQRAVGRKLRRKSPNAPWLTVVGVASDVMDCGLGSPIGPTFYVPYFQQNTATARVTLVVRTESDPVALGSAIQQAVWSADPQQPIDRVRTVEAALEESTAQPRFRAVVLSAFGLTGAVLACVGVYGVAAYAAGRRRRELGLRIALGADPSAVVRLLLRQSMRPVLVGLALGLAIGMVSARWLTSVLPAGERLGMPTMSVMAGILLGCSLLATWIPAARAARLAPMNALRLD